MKTCTTTRCVTHSRIYYASTSSLFAPKTEKKVTHAHHIQGGVSKTLVCTQQQQCIIMLGGSYLATPPIKKWPRPTTTPTTPLPARTGPTVTSPAHVETPPTPTPRRSPHSSTARPCCRCTAARRTTRISYTLDTNSSLEQDITKRENLNLTVQSSTCQSLLSPTCHQTPPALRPDLRRLEQQLHPLLHTWRARGTQALQSG